MHETVCYRVLRQAARAVGASSVGGHWSGTDCLGVRFDGGVSSLEAVLHGCGLCSSDGVRTHSRWKPSSARATTLSPRPPVCPTHDFPALRQSPRCRGMLRATVRTGASNARGATSVEGREQLSPEEVSALRRELRSLPLPLRCEGNSGPSPSRCFCGGGRLGGGPRARPHSMNATRFLVGHLTWESPFDLIDTAPGCGHFAGIGAPGATYGVSCVAGEWLYPC